MSTLNLMTFIVSAKARVNVIFTLRKRLYRTILFYLTFQEASQIELCTRKDDNEYIFLKIIDEESFFKMIEEFNYVRPKPIVDYSQCSKRALKRLEKYRLSR